MMTYLEISVHPEFLALCKNKTCCSAEWVRRIERNAIGKLMQIPGLYELFLEYRDSPELRTIWDAIDDSSTWGKK